MNYTAKKESEHQTSIQARGLAFFPLEDGGKQISLLCFHR